MDVVSVMADSIGEETDVANAGIDGEISTTAGVA
jgi:hypothetical protein